MNERRFFPVILNSDRVGPNSAAATSVCHDHVSSIASKCIDKIYAAFSVGGTSTAKFTDSIYDGVYYCNNRFLAIVFPDEYTQYTRIQLNTRLLFTPVECTTFFGSAAFKLIYFYSIFIN